MECRWLDLLLQSGQCWAGAAGQVQQLTMDAAGEAALPWHACAQAWKQHALQNPRDLLVAQLVAFPGLQARKGGGEGVNSPPRFPSQWCLLKGSAWCSLLPCAGFFWVRQLRPFMRRAKQESRRVAELLSQLPPEMAGGPLLTSCCFLIDMCGR